MNLDTVALFTGTFFLLVLLSTTGGAFIPPAVAFGDVHNATDRKPQFSSVLFTGDVLLARHVEYLQSKLGAEYPWGGEAFAQFSDPAVVVNFEAAIPQQHTPTKAGGMRFSVPTSSLQSLTDAGVTHASLANNHSGDFGTAAALHTREALSNSGIASFGNAVTVGSTSHSFIPVGDTAVAVVGLHLLESEIEPGSLEAYVDQLSKESVVQIAYVHWGNEYEVTHSSKQREQAEALVAAGFDVVIGHHPHVVQDIEVITGVPVFYSLGNYIFDQYFSRDVMVGLLLELVVDTDDLVITLHPVESYTSASQPRLLQTQGRTAFLTELAARSEPALQSYISSGVFRISLQRR